MSGIASRAQLRRAAGLAVMAVLGAALYDALRLVRAEILLARNTGTSIESAIRLAPDNAHAWSRLAAVSGKTAAIGALEHAVALSPRASSLWIELGLRAEMEGDIAGAERRLLHAASIDRTYAPRWTIASFYFRRKDRENFRPWAGEAARLAYGDLTALFQLCRQLNTEVVPETPHAQREYVGFLLGERDWAAAAAAASKLARLRRPEDEPLLLGACSRLVEARETGSAVELWNGIRPRDALAPERGASLTNGDFALPLLGEGFDWRIPRLPGVSAARTDSSLRISFSGSQPPVCEVLWQYLPVIAGRRYRLGFEYRTSGIAPGSGLRWRLLDFSPASGRLTESSGLASETWAAGSASFAAPGNGGLLRLVLAYQRAPGTTRIEGTLWIRRITLEFER